MIRLRFSFARGEEVKYLSHLDLMRLFQRALRRAGIPVARTRGFNPRPRISLTVPLPLGVTADREYGEIYLKEALSPPEFVKSLNDRLPPGLCLTGAGKVEPGARSLGAVINAALYRVARPGACSASAREWQEAVENLLVRPEIKITRRGRSGKADKVVDIRPYIYNLRVDTGAATAAVVMVMLLQVGSKGGVSPMVVLEQLAAETGREEELWRWQIHRRGLYIYGEELISPLSGGGNYFWMKKSL